HPNHQPHRTAQPHPTLVAIAPRSTCKPATALAQKDTTTRTTACPTTSTPTSDDSAILKILQ
ncbi:MAG: hypothetical protein HC860_05295, partial [Alkalinema sp. RU_4_3]|nr:hypothetical protein [Alkalinema sp. RU_4_3]